MDKIGEARFVIIGMAQMGIGTGDESETKNGYMKQFLIDGVNGFKKQDKSSNITNTINKITFVINDRF